VPQTLIDLAQRDAESITLAEEGFLVLQSPDMPSVLIELGYLFNPADEMLLQTTSTFSGWPPRWPGLSIIISEVGPS
jgi:hypothetical protein